MLKKQTHRPYPEPMGVSLKDNKSVEFIVSKDEMKAFATNANYPANERVLVSICHPGDDEVLSEYYADSPIKQHYRYDPNPLILSLIDKYKDSS